MPGSSLQQTPKSKHTSDPVLQPFLGPSFDPTAYLNSTFPSLFIATPAVPILPRGSLTLIDLTSQTQSQLTQLSALSARLTSTLTQLTDDILRSGTRLAYDVELLRGEAASLAEVLTESVLVEVQTFVPDDTGFATLDVGRSRPQSRKSSIGKLDLETEDETTGHGVTLPTAPSAVPEPEVLTRLRTLHHIRSRLQSVISTFDLALSWPLPPSATSTSTSNFISVSAPLSNVSTTPGSTLESLETKGQAAQQALRSSVTELLAMDRGAEGVLKAEERIEQLRQLVEVWRGTGEEKYRVRFVEGLAKMVADRRREEEAKGTLERRESESEQEGGVKEDTQQRKGLLGGLGGGLRRLRDEIYLD